ncbi:MAG: hypothetical protein KGS61_21575 [Verrucomicrobia bacterium]|nr:hypothetical protein [Verrucomicrobiota bacterium]
MIDPETQLRLQAYLDGELPARDREPVAERLDHDPEARAWFTELQHLRSLLAQGELERPLPETREFYWARIEREIRRPEAGAPRASAVPWLAWGLKWVVPAAVAVALACLLVPLLHQGPNGALAGLGQAQEIETPLQQATSISFRSEADGVSVVWVDTHGNE